MKKYRALGRGPLSIALLFSICSCATVTSPHSQHTSERAPLLSGLEFAPVEFKSALPSGIETVEQSVLDKFDLRSLEIILAAVKKYDILRFEVLGFTDDAECAGIECTTLSLRRATLVRNWLVSRGVSGNQLAEPIGHGSNMPIDDNSSDSGRSRNRRVEINILP